MGQSFDRAGPNGLSERSARHYRAGSELQPFGGTDRREGFRSRDRDFFGQNADIGEHPVDFSSSGRHSTTAGGAVVRRGYGGFRRESWEDSRLSGAGRASGRNTF